MSVIFLRDLEASPRASNRDGHGQWPLAATYGLAVLASLGLWWAAIGLVSWMVKSVS